MRDEADQCSSLQEIVSTIGLAQAQLMRSCEEIRQIRQDILGAKSVGSMQVNPPADNYLLPPISMPGMSRTSVGGPVFNVPPISDHNTRVFPLPETYAGQNPSTSVSHQYPYSSTNSYNR